ncbi:Sjogren's syndrome/scleroderma autoantigen 1 family protein [Halorubrum luteum]
MSDEFDKEAEREKLREKFARDEQKREHTQRMSELLLKGATMTNKHCEQCSDPIFRHDGREFCPTCNRPANGDDASGNAPNAADDGVDTQRRDAGTGSGTDAPADVETTTVDATSAAARAPGTARGTRRRSRSADDGGPVDGPVDETIDDRSGSSQVDDRMATGQVDDEANARASLSRTLARFARAAEETDDPRRAREHLKAAREAAETLAALDR